MLQAAEGREPYKVYLPWVRGISSFPLPSCWWVRATTTLSLDNSHFDSSNMHSRKSSTTKPIVLRTERLVLRMADPAYDADCEAILNMNRDPSASQGGQSKLGIDTIEAVRRKCQRQGPTAEFCTLAPPPYGQSFLIYLRSRGDEAEDEVIGEIGLSFRREMPVS